jgi:MFS family permease
VNVRAAKHGVASVGPKADYSTQSKYPESLSVNLVPMKQGGLADVRVQHAVVLVPQVPWWKEPTKDQWYAYSASWLGWTLDAFDFTVFLFIIGPIADEFKVPVTEVTIVFTLTLWMRLLGATAAGWLGDRIGRRWPLMISILWYSFCNFIAGFSPTFMFLLIFRTLLGIGMGAEWPAGAALAMESWPTRSRGLMSGILQGSWGLGYALAAAANWLLFADFGWRGLLWIGILPAFAVIYIRFFVKEPEVWAENKRQQTAQQTEVRMPLFTIFKRKYLWNTLTGCAWMASAFCVYYSIWALFPTYLQRELHWAPKDVFVPVFFANLIVFGGNAVWGYVSDNLDDDPASTSRPSSASSSRRSTSSPRIRSGSSPASSSRASSPARSTARTRATCASASRPRCGRPRRASSITRARSSAVSSRRCSATSRTS